MKPSRSATRVLAPALILGMGLTACGGSFGDDGGSDSTGETGGETFTVGLISPVTGVAALEGNALKQGFELGIEKVNANGGVFGNDIEIVFIDDQGDAAISTQSAQRLVQQDNVDYLFGTIAGDTAQAVAAVAEDAEVPFSTAIDGNVPYCSPHFWPFGATEIMLLEDLVPDMMEEHGDNVALVGNDYVFPRQYHGVSKELIEEAGGNVVVEEYAPLGTSDWEPVINKIDSADPDWILTAVVGGDAISFTQQADQFGILDDLGLTGTSVKQEFFPSISEVIAGEETVMPYSDRLPGDENEQFVSDYREQYDYQDPIPGVAATAYHAAQYIAEAANAAGSTEAADISAEMVNVDMAGLLGESKFREDNHQFSTQMYTFEIGADGAYEPIEDLGVIEDTMEKSCS